MLVESWRLYGPNYNGKPETIIVLKSDYVSNNARNGHLLVEMIPQQAYAGVVVAGEYQSEFIDKNSIALLVKLCVSIQSRRLLNHQSANSKLQNSKS